MNDQFDEVSYMGTWLALDNNFLFEDVLEQNMADMSFDNSILLPTAGGCGEEVALPDNMFDFSLLEQEYQDCSVGIMDDSFYASTSPSMTSSMEVGVSPASLAWPPQDPYAVPYSSGSSPIGFEEQYLLSSLELPTTTSSAAPFPQTSTSPKAHSPSDSITRDLSCTECGKDHKDKRSLRRHYNTHHPLVAEALGIKEVRSQCKYCHESFSRKDHLQRHLSNKHGRPRQSRSRR